MSSADSEPHLESTSSLNGHENNDLDNKRKNENIANSESQNKVEKKLRNKYLSKMLYVLKEFLIMVVVAVTYAAIANDPPKVGKSPAAYRFFSDDAFVTDWYKGEINDAINQARNADIAFVMYYAPWDAECQHARNEFQIAAKYMHKQVTFLAVNCWQPGSECKTQYSKVHKWPVLIAYPTHGRGVQYNGPLVAVYMMAFLKKVIAPFKIKDIYQHLVQHDAVVVCAIGHSPYSRRFSIFYQVALLLLERDPMQDVAVSIDLETSVPHLYMFMWNDSLVYTESEWEVEPILNWILKNVQRMPIWISPSGSKSASLSNYLQPGPTLILFTPRNPLAMHNDIYSMLKAISYDYSHEDKNSNMHILKLAIKGWRRIYYFKQLKMIEECNKKKIKLRRITTSNYWSNTSYCYDKNYQVENIHEDDNMIKYHGGMKRVCSSLLENFDNNEVDELKYRADVIYKTSKLSDRPDYKSSKNLKEALKLETCTSFLVSQKYQVLAFSRDLYNNKIQSFNVTGLKYKTNKTLSFIAMDSLNYHHYAEKLGIDLSKKPNKTAVVILDNKMESHYVMSEDVTDTNVRNFIYKYTTGSLTRALSSLATVRSVNTHSYPNDHYCGFADAKICVKELSAKSFMQIISQSNKAVIIFYYSKQCSFCNGISYRFLTVAKYLSTMKEIEFARVDGDLNLLPWEYTMEVYPTILFIPANKGSESRVFPMDLPITLKNLIGFILANLQPSLKLEAMWTLCTSTKLDADMNKCIASLRLQILQTVEKTLQEWRTSHRDGKKSIYLKLELLHDLHTLFVQSTHNATSAVTIFDRLKFNEFEPSETTRVPLI